MNLKEAAQEIRARIQTKERTASYLEKSRGGGYVCPYCGAGKKSGCVSVFDDGFFSCNACHNEKNGGKQGSIIDAYMLRYSVDFAQAVKELGREICLDIDAEMNGNRARTGKKAVAGMNYRTNEKNGAKAIKANFSADIQAAQKNLDFPRAVEYITGRGISIETARRLRFGFFNSWTNPKGGKVASPRIILPFANDCGYLVRSLDDADGSKQNVGQAGIFNADALKDGGVVFVCEGAFDAASVEEVGRRAVALNGKGNGRLLIEALQDVGQDFDGIFLIAFDNDEAGEEGAAKLKSRLDEIGALCAIVDACGGHNDINDFLRADPVGLDFCLLEHEENGKILLAKGKKPDSLLAYVESGGFEADTKTAACVPTGFPAFDSWLKGGLMAGRLHVVAARTGLGKTAFQWLMAENIAAAEKAGVDVLYFTCELTRAELLARVYTRRAFKRGREVDMNDILRGAADVHEEKNEFFSSVGDRLTVIDGGYSESVADIRQYAERYKARNHCRMCLFVDYLQAVADSKGKPENVAIADAAKELKQLAKDLQIPIFTASSMARSSYQDAVSFASFYGSCNIEFSADCIVGLQYAVIDSPAWRDVDGKNEKDKAAKRAQLLDAAEDESPRKIQLCGLKYRGNNPHVKIPLLFDSAHFDIQEAGAGTYKEPKAAVPSSDDLSAADIESLLDM